MPFFWLLGLSAKKEVEKLNPEEFFLNKRDRCKARQAKWREGFCNYEKNFPKTATVRFRSQRPAHTMGHRSRGDRRFSETSPSGRTDVSMYSFSCQDDRSFDELQLTDVAGPSSERNSKTRSPKHMDTSAPTCFSKRVFLPLRSTGTEDAKKIGGLPLPASHVWLVWA
jgi:hypothetical protein